MIQILKLTNINEIIENISTSSTSFIQLLLVCRASNAMPPLILMHRTTCLRSHLISVLSSVLQSLIFEMFISSNHRVASFARFVEMWPSEEAKCRVARGCHVTRPGSCRVLRCVASVRSYSCVPSAHRQQQQPCVAPPLVRCPRTAAGAETLQTPAAGWWIVTTAA